LEQLRKLIAAYDAADKLAAEQELSLSDLIERAVLEYARALLTANVSFGPEAYIAVQLEWLRRA
jgi:hypothetical protein